jgi:hypothetical protein
VLPFAGQRKQALAVLSPNLLEAILGQAILDRTSFL